jgi:enoyl-CoA hydratase/carnithine racemase
MSEPERPAVLSERRGAVLIITLNRPARRNAVDRAASYAVDELLRAAEADDSIGAIVLTGAGDRAFCSGMDLKEAAVTGAGGGLIPGRGFCGITETPCTKPLIAAVNGAAVAGGFEICLACDLIVAADSAVFGLPEVARGMVAFTGGVQRLARGLPRAVAMEFILTGGYLPAARLHGLGLVNRVVPQAEVLDAALALADQVLANSWHALRHAKALYEDARDMALPEAIAHGHAQADALMHSDASREGIAAYATGRQARFQKD